jgi:hypothetical protein
MRYIYYILIIVFGLSVIIAYELRDKPQTTENAALIINKRIITVEEFNRLYSGCPHTTESKNEFLNDLIVKELLIQESHKQGIDREEPFRKSLQNFYEQSLIKLLMDRKFSSLNVSVSEKELDRRLALLRKRFHITILYFDTFEKARQGAYRKSETRAVHFDDLSQTLQGKIIPLTEGTATEPFKNGDVYSMIKLDRIEPDLSRIIPASEKEKIQTMLIEEQKEKLINDWISDLKNKATIRILVTGEK